MQVSELEALETRLHQLRERLARVDMPADRPLGEDHPLVQDALACEFMLPQPLSCRTLAATVDKKIGNVEVLLERARRHAELPEAAQLAAEQEYTLSEEDYQLARHEGDAGHDRPQAP